MTSTLITRVSAAVLFLGGVALLFAPDVVLPLLAPGYPTGALWLGQLLAAAWLGVAALNWLSRSTLLGGIYGRPVVMANAGLYFIGALALLKAGLWLLASPAVLLALAYGFLLFRGPLDRDLQAQSAS